MSLLDPPAELLADRYQLVERLGEGSTGVVFRSFDRELEEWVGVKLLHPELTARANANVGLRRELRLARRVAHRNVARTFELGRAGEHQFLTMEYIPAESLRAWQARVGPMPPGLLPAVALDLCRGLAAAHAAGVVHGDIKPANILLAPGRGAVLTDIGVAHGLCDPSADASLLGDALYAAPELLVGGARTPRSDIYALAIVLFELLTGASPWPGMSTEQQLACRQASPGPDLRALAPSLAGGWLELLSACLQPRPEDRPADAQALLARLIELYRGTGHVPMSHTRDGEESLIPLGSIPGARRITVHRIVPADPLLAADAAWISHDLAQALRHIRSLRLVDASASHQGPVADVRCTLARRGDGVRFIVRVTPDRGAAELELTIDRPCEQLPVVGVELAARILAALDLRPPPPQQATRPLLLRGDALDRYVQARAAMLTLRTDLALPHYEAALALAPRHRALRLGYVVARVTHALAFKSPDAEALADVRALVEATVAEFGDAGDACYAMALLLISVGQPVEATRWVCASLSRGPSQAALIVLGIMLIQIGRLPDAARRFEIAATLEPACSILWQARAELAVYQDRWDDFFAIFNGPLTELRARGVHAALFLLQRPDPATLERLAVAVADNQDELAPPALRTMQALLDFLLARRDRRQVVDELAALPDDAACSGLIHVILVCEMACIVGDLPRARAMLLRADQEHNLTGWQWLTQNPLLAPIRGAEPYFTVQAHVRERTDAIAELIWG